MHNLNVVNGLENWPTLALIGGNNEFEKRNSGTIKISARPGVKAAYARVSYGNSSSFCLCLIYSLRNSDREHRAAHINEFINLRAVTTCRRRRLVVFVVRRVACRLG